MEMELSSMQNLATKFFKRFAWLRTADLLQKKNFFHFISIFPQPRKYRSATNFYIINTRFLSEKTFLFVFGILSSCLEGDLKLLTIKVLSLILLSVKYLHIKQTILLQIIETCFDLAVGSFLRDINTKNYLHMQ